MIKYAGIIPKVSVTISEVLTGPFLNVACRYSVAVISPIAANPAVFKIVFSEILSESRLSMAKVMPKKVMND
ncbi:MAG: hypothetical protein UX86_C0015G0038 [Candidatus Amesbacteria bacterium GW2011_GWC1_47_15]|uniref:Uncharacterized protein n=2 Tax=Candidatus Amesiibacteriota TaxID=1752730 RepID=A0A0G1UCU8_9BACT|nr:MAG: hypothetical protein UX86_C0015G0038 [Candidatus Amesbacteria bacterium GW2011_GWC1_47_15]KKU97859.1 MAG: hypothetical protein UY28_C0012G0023 [Candidatus Amesbacteria bacterium GW2011_GWB1_48_13]